MPPEVALAGLLALLALGAAWVSRSPAVCANILNIAVVTGIVWPRLYEVVLPPRYILAVYLALGAVACLLRTRESVASRTFKSVMILCYTAMALIVFLEFRLTTPAADEAYFRYIAVVPLAAVYGYYLVRSDRVNQMGRAFLSVALVSAVLAMAERVTNRPLLAKSFDSFIGDQYRATVFSEHTLVLASILVCAVAVAYATTQGIARVVAIAILLAGIGATFSRGGLALAVGYLVIAIGWSRIRSMPRYSTVFRVLTATVFLALPLTVLIYPSLFHGVTSSDPTTASLQYRGAIYSSVITSLQDRPWGWGPSGVPAGEYTFRSQFGVLDINTTVDSEFVVMALDFGYLGVLLWAVISVVVIKRLKADRWWSHVAVLVTTAGFYLAIHSWLGILALWALSIGASLASPKPRRTEGVDESASVPDHESVSSPTEARS